MEEENIYTRIRRIEEELQRLKLDLSREEKNIEANQKAYEIGDLVRILNPSRGQETKGKVVRVGSGTEYITIETKKGKVVRHIRNIEAIRK